MRPWICLATQTIIESPWLRLTADKCELPSGLILEPFFVIHEPDWVNILAVDDAQRILVVRQYRYAGNIVCTELPGGVVDPGEELLDAAKRELLEETGFEAEVWDYAGSLLANPARQTNKVHLFVARQLTPKSEQSLDVSEDIAFAFMSQEAIELALQSGQFSQAIHVGSYYRGLHFLAAQHGIQAT